MDGLAAFGSFGRRFCASRGAVEQLTLAVGPFICFIESFMEPRPLDLHSA